MHAVFDAVKQLLPQPNRWCSYRHALSEIRHSSSEKMIEMHACVNDCILYVDAPLSIDVDVKRQHAQEIKCPMCKEPRRQHVAGVPVALQDPRKVMHKRRHMYRPVLT
jgi:hypothetical protein